MHKTIIENGVGKVRCLHGHNVHLLAGILDVYEEKFFYIVWCQCVKDFAQHMKLPLEFTCEAKADETRSSF